MDKKEIDEIEKHNEYVMKRMHPAAMIPGFFIAFMVIVGCLFKNYMGGLWANLIKVYMKR